MKKILIGFLVLSLCACSLGMSNTPKEKVKEFLDKYKNQDTEVISDLEDSISSEYTGNYKERYKTIMINQYKNMDYRITDEIVDKDTALVTADVTVYDFSTVISNANTYFKEHLDEFSKKSSDETTRENTVDNDKFLDYKLGLLEKASNRKTYTIEFTLTKDNDSTNWTLDSLSNTDI